MHRMTADGKIRVRFAPSPTGHLHIGGVRTALFNYLFARRHGGTFILRIEDTDRSRSTEESIEQIIEGMKWLGLAWDEGPYRQTDRLERYQAQAQRLLEEGKAYPCYCPPEELEARRKEAIAKGWTPRYDGRCRDRREPVAGIQPALRFKAPQTGQTAVEDLIKGSVVFDNAQLDDLILLRSDGTPTYNFCVVVDDVDMKITHVIRGDDHLNNTPRQVQLYRAFGYETPHFGHVSMILGSDKARLSKRHGATSVLAYRDMGYLPEAVVNYLVRLGWSAGDQEIFSLDEMIQKFDLAQVGRSAAVFNPDKLLWLNSHYIHHSRPDRLTQSLRPFLMKEGLLTEGQPVDELRLRRIIVSLQERSRTLVEMAQSAVYFFSEDYPVDEKAREKFLTPAVKPALEALRSKLASLSVFHTPTIEKAFKEVLERLGLKMSELAQPVRVSLTGRTVSPGIYDVLEILGKERSLARLQRAIGAIV
jgi:glutamyl-tRNA synthetase